MVPQLVIITGLSGSGMSSAMNVFEDLGYFLCRQPSGPAHSELRAPVERKETGITHSALVVDIREGEFLDSFPHVLLSAARSGRPRDNGRLPGVERCSPSAPFQRDAASSSDSARERCSRQSRRSANNSPRSAPRRCRHRHVRSHCPYSARLSEEAIRV